MIEIPPRKYRKTGNRLHILVALSSAQESLEMAARAMEHDKQSEHAHKTRNIAQSTSARRDLMEQQWEIDDAAKRAVRKGKAKKGKAKK
jgi:hypothetical protein